MEKVTIESEKVTIELETVTFKMEQVTFEEKTLKIIFDPFLYFFNLLLQ